MYTDLSDEDKLELAIKFVAQGQPMPEPIEQFLRDNQLYELIISPGEYDVITGS